MSDQSRSFKETGFGSNTTNNFMYGDNHFLHPNQLQNNSQIVPPDMFSRPPPTMFPEYQQMPQLSLRYPPPPSPAASFSVPPPSLPSQPIIQTLEKPVGGSEINYYGSEMSYYNQQYPVSFPQQSYQMQPNPVPLPTSNMNSLQQFVPSLEQLNTQSPGVSIQSKREPTSVSDDSVDEHWIKNWLENIRKFKTEDFKQKENKDNSLAKFKIYDFKEKIIEISKLLAQLENLSKSLSVIYKSLSDDEWISRCLEIEEKKKRLSSLLGSIINNEKLIQCVKQKLNKRKKKRLRQKRKREEWKQQKLENSVKRQQLHKSIDRWLEDMKDAVERGKRDEELKREADSVLADVTRKKTEAKRQIALLSALLKLREARVTAQKAIGKNISQQQTDAFNNVIERLKSLWMKQLKEYTLEEQGLKVMLNEAAAEEKSNEALRKKEILRDWEVAIFGDNKTNDYQPNDLNMFVSVRKQWDQFVVEEGTVMSSSIPPGWVLPVKASSSDWMKFNKS